MILILAAVRGGVQAMKHKEYRIPDRQKKLWLCLCIFALAASAYVWYCSRMMVEVPHLSWLDQIPLAELFYQGRLGFADLCSRYGEHGLLGSNLLYLLNVALFHGMTGFDVVVNDGIVILTGAVVVYMTYAMLKDTAVCLGCIFGEVLFLFGFAQGSSGGMETQVRLGLLFFLLAMVFVDRQLQGWEASGTGISGSRQVWLTVLMIFLSINVFGTLYSFAGVPFVWLVILVDTAVRRRKGCQADGKKLLTGAVYMAATALYVVQYRLAGYMQYEIRQEQGVWQQLSYALLHPVQTVLCLFSWYANGLLGWAYHESVRYSRMFWLCTGAAAAGILLAAVFLFFRSGMQKQTWIPLMCIIYSFGVFCLVLLGREVSWEWFANEWYHVHLKLAYASAVWIFGYAGAGHVKRTGWKALCACSILILSLYAAGESHNARKRAPYVQAYYQNMQKYLYIEDEKEMPVDASGNTPLLHSLDQTMESVRILRTWHLSVFWTEYKKTNRS